MEHNKLCIETPQRKMLTGVLDDLSTLSSGESYFDNINNVTKFSLTFKK